MPKHHQSLVLQQHLNSEMAQGQIEDLSTLLHATSCQKQVEAIAELLTDGDLKDTAVNAIHALTVRQLKNNHKRRSASLLNSLKKTF